MVASYIKRCLHKDRKQRIRDIGDVSLALDGAFEAGAPRVAPSVAVTLPVWRRALPVAGTAIVAILLTGLAAWSRWPAVEPRSTTRFDHVLPAGQQLLVTQRPVVAISPDGRHFVYQTTEGLYLRSMGDLEARLIPGSGGYLMNPFFSPDGEWVGYVAGTNRATDMLGVIGALRKIAVTGGAPVTLSAATNPFGASWAPDNTILFGQRAGIMRVSADGGTPQLIIPAVEGEQMYGPQLLPDRTSVLFSVTRNMGPATRWDQAQVVVQSLISRQRTVLVDGGSDARYLPTGHLVYRAPGRIVRSRIRRESADCHWRIRSTPSSGPTARGCECRRGFLQRVRSGDIGVCHHECVLARSGLDEAPWHRSGSHHVDSRRELRRTRACLPTAVASW